MGARPTAPGPSWPASQPSGAPPQTAPPAAYGWEAPPGTPAAPRAGGVARPRWRGTIAVAVIVAGVVWGGMAADQAIAEPSAGKVAISQPVYMTAAPGWVSSTAAGDVPDGVQLQNSNALLIAQVLSTSYSGDARALLETEKASFAADAANISFGDERDETLNGKPASVVTFSALVSGAGGSGMLDGELICLVLHSGGHGYAVVIQVGVPQGYLSSVTDDIDAMAGSVEVGQ